MAKITFSDQILEEFTVDELIGVVKWIQITTTDDIPDGIEDELEEYRELGMGEVPVLSCRETVL